MMSHDTDAKAGDIGETNVCVVESIDANGSVADRTAFATEAEGAAHAAAMTAKGYKVTQSALDPLPKT